MYLVLAAALLVAPAADELGLRCVDHGVRVCAFVVRPTPGDSGRLHWPVVRLVSEAASTTATRCSIRLGERLWKTTGGDPWPLKSRVYDCTPYLRVHRPPYLRTDFPGWKTRTAADRVRVEWGLTLTWPDGRTREWYGRSGDVAVARIT